MTTFQRFALYLAMRAGVLPRVDVDLVEKAAAAVKDAELRHKRERGEYRRHVAMLAMTDGGASPRQAAAAIEIAITMGGS